MTIIQIYHLCRNIHPDAIFEVVDKKGNQIAWANVDGIDGKILCDRSVGAFEVISDIHVKVELCV